MFKCCQDISLLKTTIPKCCPHPKFSRYVTASEVLVRVRVLEFRKP